MEIPTSYFKLISPLEEELHVLYKAYFKLGLNYDKDLEGR